MHPNVRRSRSKGNGKEEFGCARSANRDLKHRQRNGRRRRFATEADWAKGFVFGGENEVLTVQLPRQTTTFSLRRTLSCYSLVRAFKDVRNLHFIRYEDGLMEAFSSSRSFCFCFEMKLNLYTDLEQLLTCSYAKFRLLKRIQCCYNVLPHLSSLRAPHSHIMFQSPLENSCLYYRLKTTWEIIKS